MTDCFVHASDLHLDAKLKNLGKLDAETVDFLRGEADKAWPNLVNLAIEKEASFMVLAGDLFDSGTAGFNARRQFKEGLERLDAEEISVFIVHGNHDPLTEDLRRRIGTLPDRTFVFDPGTPQTHRVKLNSDRLAYVSGISFGARREDGNLAELFQNLSRMDGPHVAVLHTNIGETEGHGNYAPCKEVDLARANIDYWALGHIHLRSEPVRLDGGGVYAYSGNPQGRSLKRSECHPKGALVVPINDNGTIGRPDFEKCDSVRFIRSEIEIESDEGLGDVEDAIRQSARKTARLESEGLPVVWFPSLSGRSSKPETLRKGLEEFFREENDLGDLLNGGGAGDWTIVFRHITSRDDLVGSGGLPAAAMSRLDDREALLATLRALKENLNGELVTGLVTADDEDYGINDLDDEVVRLAETLLIDALVERDG